MQYASKNKVLVRYKLKNRLFWRKGYVYVYPETRVSDLLNDQEQFIPILIGKKDRITLKSDIQELEEI